MSTKKTLQILLSRLLIISKALLSHRQTENVTYKTLFLSWTPYILLSIPNKYLISAFFNIYIPIGCWCPLC